MDGGREGRVMRVTRMYVYKAGLLKECDDRLGDERSGGGLRLVG